jgi:beta-lactamase superfamily II metal-dependent hydrolase
MLKAVRIALTVLLLALPLRAQQLEVRFLDVGQGDAALIQEGGKTALIDAGPSAKIMLYLQARGIHTIDLVVASHNHADHIGGMAAVLSGTTVRYYLDNGVPHTTATYQRTIDAVAASGAQYLSPSDRTITLGSARLHVLPPPPSRDQNNSSVGLLVEYGDFRALLTGDSEFPELQYWLRKESIPSVQVVKVAHHGSWNGTSAEWAEKTRPQVAVISVGARNSYGHPSPRVIQQWQSVGARVRRTDREGSILILANRDGTFADSAERSESMSNAHIRPLMPNTAVTAPTPGTARTCCKVCTRGMACGDSCISQSYTCHQPPGCACDARP